MNKVFYYHGKQAVIDILNHKIIKSNKIDKSLKDLLNHYENSTIPTMPVNAELLMKKYKIPEGKQLGEKLKVIEQAWVKNNFEISKTQLDSIIEN